MRACQLEHRDTTANTAYRLTGELTESAHFLAVFICLFALIIVVVVVAVFIVRRSLLRGARPSRPSAQSARTGDGCRCD